MHKAWKLPEWIHNATYPKMHEIDRTHEIHEYMKRFKFIF